MRNHSVLFFFFGGGGGFFCINFAPDMALKELWIKLLDYAYFVHRYV